MLYCSELFAVALSISKKDIIKYENNTIWTFFFLNQRFIYCISAAIANTTQVV